MVCVFGVVWNHGFTDELRIYYIIIRLLLQLYKVMYNIYC